jgi:TRAP-type C4-dicarboxylate transport system substrate-binding protein
VKSKITMTRRRLLTGTSLTMLASTGAPRIARAQQVQWTYKYANNLPETHPMNIRAREMAAAIKQETNGHFDLQIFPNSQLGSDTDTLSQIRSGGVEFFTLSGLILSTLVPAASINGIRVSRLRHRLESDGRRFGRLYPRANSQGQPDCHGQDLG